jgi:DNA-binding transcriptional LysR family regulator
MVAALPMGYPLAANGCVSLAEIASHGLIWFPEQQIPAMRTQLLSAMRRAGHEVKVVQDVNRSLTVLACVAAGLGWSLLPRSVRALQRDRHFLDLYAQVWAKLEEGLGNVEAAT